MADTGKLLVFVDLPDGGLDETGRGLLSYAARLGVFSESPWEVATIAAPEGEALADFAAYGVPAVSRVTGGDSFCDTPSLLGKVLAQLTEARQAKLVILPHNDLGCTLAPVIAASCKAALLTEVTTVRKVKGAIRISRAALGGRVAETKVWDGECPLVITVPVRCLSQVLLPSVKPSVPVISEWQPASAPEGVAATITTRIPPDPQTVDLMDAEVIFSVGKGCDSKTFEQFKELCQTLNVSYGVTRPVYDFGWTGFERMVGQTGRTVTPRLYVALGISGSMHHVGGIKDSRRIISVNSDPKAPIFTNSDEGFVADLREVLPRLLERAKSAAGGAK
jgi:electron transfer flavoprotein alpha subunit